MAPAEREELMTRPFRGFLALRPGAEHCLRRDASILADSVDGSASAPAAPRAGSGRGLQPQQVLRRAVRVCAARRAASPALTGEARLRGSGAKLVNGVAIGYGGQIGWGTVCYGSPNCAWGVDRGFVNHVEYKPDMGFTYAYPLKFPEETTGGVAAIAMNSKGHIYAVVRNDPGKPMLFEWDENYKLVHSFGADIASKAHGMAVDAEDNLWLCDQFGDTVMKFSPEREGADDPRRERPARRLERSQGPAPSVAADSMAFAPNGDIYIAMGHGNESPNDGAARILHLDKDGKFVNQWFGNAAGPGKFGMAPRDRRESE